MRRSLRRASQAAAISAIALLAAGCASVGSSAGPQASQKPTFRSTPGASATHRAKDPGKDPFASLASYIATRPGVVTAAVYDRATRKTWVFHPGIKEHTASIVKVEILGTALKQAQDAGSEPPGSEQSLLKAMIENSDNGAATELLHEVGGPSAVQRFDNSVGMSGTAVSTLAFIPGSTTLPGWGWTTTTARDEVRLVSKFAFTNALLLKPSRNFGLNLMENVEADQRWGVSFGVPLGATVALKNGWLPLDLARDTNWQVDSIGWIHGNGRDYVLAVLTNGSPDEPTGIDTIDHISSVIYNELGH
jgi:beta-lactamase class A